MSTHSRLPTRSHSSAAPPLTTTTTTGSTSSKFKYRNEPIFLDAYINSIKPIQQRSFASEFQLFEQKMLLSDSDSCSSPSSDSDDDDLSRKGQVGTREETRRRSSKRRKVVEAHEFVVPESRSHTVTTAREKDKDHSSNKVIDDNDDDDDDDDEIEIISTPARDRLESTNEPNWASKQGLRPRPTTTTTPTTTTPTTTTTHIRPRPTPTLTTTTRTEDNTLKPNKQKQKKKRLSLEEASRTLNSITDQKKLRSLYPTISNFIDYLNTLTLTKVESRRPILKHCRICFVNAYSPSTRNNGVGSRTHRRIEKNGMDLTLRIWMINALKQGCTLVKPEEFESIPLSKTTTTTTTTANAMKQIQDEESQIPNFETADSLKLVFEKGLTTHIIPLELPNRTRPSFSQILSSLGEKDQGIEIEQLGKIVKIVRYEWLLKSVEAERPLPFWERWDRDDTRSFCWGDSKSVQQHRHHHHPPGSTNQREGAKDLTKANDDEEEEEDGAAQDLFRVDGASQRTIISSHQHEEEQEGAISPLNETDFPRDELAMGYDFKKLRPMTPAQLSGEVSFNSDPIVE